MENPFVKLFAIDFKDHLEVKKSGSTELKYVSWAYAWAEVKKLYPSASYEVKKFNGLPYVYDPITGFMVYTSVTIEGVSHEMWLPVLDGANKAMKAVPYTYTTPKWDYNPQTRRREKFGMEERTVEAAFSTLAFRFLNMRMPPLWKMVRSFPMEKAVSGMRRTGVTANSILSWRKSASSRILTTKMVSANRSLPGSLPPIRPTPPAIPTPAFVTAQASTRIS